ncbi:UDP-4-amino-4,6-dideoxy-N-acetyl-beta-L-altrosamine N-acetyltransferase [Luteimonas sp. MC1782]|uniref:UDP-4-amino-4, 6-dideoxy-N-acetyl-beta-L-altrosamine N-acetyltransferase n=1 Tax=Luteimonas sp. MC1782 TaxID=2760305 RepID=UPI001602DA56|nr:UDP-4-amino-4,6-dideoxy-N-acetyl-beta-L-altrosamine N-acetyltransferase [Luteimonas sp. MC1782]MBB1472236.1 UDP-4-amino-4,6-dideoxy-N-acetyl-beta-L-altrosamine N-acetyltransferase [Luteimonas sp. MC1782]
MNEGDLDLVLSWRNHLEVRRYMYTQHEITREEHARWFARTSQDPERHLLMFEIDTTPLGFINLHQIASGGIGDWGFYVAPHAPKGTGRTLGLTALRYAFEAARLHKLCGQALAVNEPSIRFHLNLGFQREGVLRQQHFDGQKHYDVVCFGLLVSEWHLAN